MSYNPKPIDTSGVKLPRSLRSLIERLAENNHDIWARKRLEEGWRYGPERDNIKKTNPYLVPYAELSESEKDYDRVLSVELLKNAVALGYRITPPEKTLDADRIYEALGKLRSKKPDEVSVSELLRIWSVIASGHWGGSARLYRQLGEQILNAGEPLVAYDVISKGLGMWPKDFRLRQLQGLSLARGGAVKSANRILRELYNEGRRDGETLGILARTHKDMAALSPTVSQRNEQLRIALSLYVDGYRQAMQNQKRIRLDEALYNGINAASIFLLQGSREKAESLAGEVQKICRRKLRQKSTNYWALATLGETALILRELSEAEEYYGLAAEAEKGNYGLLSTTRRQARLLLHHMGLDQKMFDKCFHIPGIAVLIGPQFAKSAFKHSSTAMNRMRGKIGDALRKIDAGFGYGSAAAGPEIIFMEEVLKRKGEAHIVLPFEKEAFSKAYVDTIKGRDWGRQFKRLISRATRLIIACEQCREPTSMAFDFARAMHLGLARLHGQILDVPVTPLIVQDGLHHERESPTEFRQPHGSSPEVVDVREEMNGAELSTPILESQENHSGIHSPPNEAEQSIKVMLFADVVGYSSMTEESIPHFVKRFMGLISNLVEISAKKPLTANTWGDAVYFVFADVEAAAAFALELRDRIPSTRWQKFGLPEHLSLRISLHAGPVFHCEDPILKRLKYTGSHVSRAARIEPITPPGQIYASEEFAAISAEGDARGFSYDYVGKIPLPKGSGTIPLYLIRRFRDRL